MYIRCCSAYYLAHQLQLNMYQSVYIVLICLLAGLTEVSAQSKYNFNSEQDYPYYTFLKKHMASENTLVYTDAAYYGYRVAVPAYWNIKPAFPNVLQGVIFENDSTSASLSISCQLKKDIESFEDFEDWVIGKYSPGETPEWDQYEKLISWKTTNKFDRLGKGYEAVFSTDGAKSYCWFILLESSKSYIWITFRTNRLEGENGFDRFKDIVKQFSRL